MTLHNQLLVGLQDLTHPGWQAAYFPDECPDEWYFTYYSNDFRGAWLPAPFLVQASDALQADLQIFTEDQDDDFYFVLSVTSKQLARLSNSLTQLAPIVPQLAALVLEMPAANEFDSWLAAAKTLQAPCPVAVQPADSLSLAKAQHQALAVLIETRNWSQVWQANTDTVPVGSGEFLPVIGGGEDLRAQCVLIEKIADWMGDSRSAGLFFPPPATAGSNSNDNLAEAALNVKSLAEIMGV